MLLQKASKELQHSMSEKKEKVEKRREAMMKEEQARLKKIDKKETKRLTSSKQCKVEEADLGVSGGQARGEGGVLVSTEARPAGELGAGSDGGGTQEEQTHRKDPGEAPSLEVELECARLLSSLLNIQLL